MTGYLHIFNITINREGSVSDVNLLRETFLNMGAKVEYTEDPDEKAIKREMDKIKMKNLKPYLYVAIAYMSHGQEDDVAITSKEIIHIQKTILMPLCRNEALNGKLKWLIMQTCRGSYDFVKQSTEGPMPSIPFPKYCVKFFATSEGMGAYRTKNFAGKWQSLFIKKLCARLNAEYKKHDIISIFNHTRDDVSSIELSVCGVKIQQIPVVEDNLGSNKFYFTSGLVEM